MIKIELITLNNIVKKYDDKVIMDGLDLKIYQNQFISIKGASGIGKSTLLNILAGLEKSDSGKHVFNNESMHDMNNNQLSEVRGKYMGYISQNNPMIRKRTVRENILFPLTLGNHNIQKANVLIEELSAYLKIDHLLDNKIEKLSGGEKQRVGIVRALAKEPMLLIADEPTGSLDENTTILVFELFKELSAKKMTIIMSSHSHLSKSYVDKEYIFNDNKLMPSC
ncbi:ABC transporter ATP-binding protein [Solibacillus cecembensis]|uniref:ABC transporter ATP-binding protein n=1 Tax=Solibacillus cecembensis TaxID=459347 RepID=UPI003CFC3981